MLPTHESRRRSCSDRQHVGASHQMIGSGGAEQAVGAGLRHQAVETDAAAVVLQSAPRIGCQPAFGQSVQRSSASRLRLIGCGCASITS